MVLGSGIFILTILKFWGGYRMSQLALSSKLLTFDELGESGRRALVSLYRSRFLRQDFLIKFFSELGGGGFFSNLYLSGGGGGFFDGDVREEFLGCVTDSGIDWDRLRYFLSEEYIREYFSSDRYRFRYYFSSDGPYYVILRKSGGEYVACDLFWESDVEVYSGCV